MELDKNKISLPLVVTRGFIMFPHNSASLDIIKEESEKAVARAQNSYDGYLILSSQINTKINTVDTENVYKVGCLCQITNSKSNPDGSLKIGNFNGKTIGDKVTLLDSVSYDRTMTDTYYLYIFN